jgi:glutaminyl-tRNA synthetase
MDDTNPEKEEAEYVNSIIEDVGWLGFEPSMRPGPNPARAEGLNRQDRIFYASDYFDRLYDYAVELIKKGKAYVCDLSADEVRAARGTLTAPGKESPGRARPVGENLDLFGRMKNGEFPDGSRTLRAKIDMADPRIIMRDPVLYRIKRERHHRTLDRWCIYPMYDFAHCLSDSIEGITHSICTLEFENNRPLYDWILDALGAYHPQQIEFARLNLSHTVLSKRKLLQLVAERLVDGWDDPRMPTISGFRRRGYTPSSIRAFCDGIGVSKMNSIIEIAVLENTIREELNRSAPRAMAVLRPLKLVITNYPEGGREELEAVNNPEDPSAGTRKVPFGRELYIERDDFRETPPPKFFRLSPGKEVRLRYAYFVKCSDCVKDPKTGEVTEVRCTYDPSTRGGNAPDGRRVKSTIHWVSARDAVGAEVRLYETLFTKRDPDDAPEGKDFRSNLNPRSIETLKSCRLEPSLADTKAGSRVQFERLGYFYLDPASLKEGNRVFSRIVSLKDEWARVTKQKGSGPF